MEKIKNPFARSGYKLDRIEAIDGKIVAYPTQYRVIHYWSDLFAVVMFFLGIVIATIGIIGLIFFVLKKIAKG